VSDFLKKAKDLADRHDVQVDQGLERLGDMIDDRTGGRFSDKIDRGVDEAQERTGGDRAE
jgi:hypothetical protein